MEVSGEIHTPAAVRRKIPFTHQIGGRLGPRISLDVVEKNLLQLLKIKLQLLIADSHETVETRHVKMQYYVGRPWRYTLDAGM
jgi:hypothetical protein